MYVSICVCVSVRLSVCRSCPIPCCAVSLYLCVSVLPMHVHMDMCMKAKKSRKGEKNRNREAKKVTKRRETQKQQTSKNHAQIIEEHVSPNSFTRIMDLSMHGVPGNQTKIMVAIVETTSLGRTILRGQLHNHGGRSNTRHVHTPTTNGIASLWMFTHPASVAIDLQLCSRIVRHV